MAAKRRQDEQMLAQIDDSALNGLDNSQGSSSAHASTCNISRGDLKGVINEIQPILSQA